VDASAFASVVSNFSVFTCRLSSISYYRTIDDIPLSCSCSFPPWMKIYIYIYRPALFHTLGMEYYSIPEPASALTCRSRHPPLVTRCVRFSALTRWSKASPTCVRFLRHAQHPSQILFFFCPFAFTCGANSVGNFFLQCAKNRFPYSVFKYRGYRDCAKRKKHVVDKNITSML
jgi:hypothetical protein